jgi:hypothetical protein
MVSTTFPQPSSLRIDEKAVLKPFAFSQMQNVYRYVAASASGENLELLKQQNPKLAVGLCTSNQVDP